MQQWFEHLVHKKREIDKAEQETGLEVRIHHPLYDPIRSFEERRDVWRPLKEPFAWNNARYWRDPFVPPGYEYLFVKLPNMDRYPPPRTPQHEYLFPKLPAAPPPSPNKVKMEKMNKKKARVLLSTSLPVSPNK